MGEVIPLLALFLVPLLAYAGWSALHERRDRLRADAAVKRLLAEEQKKHRVIVDTVLTKVEPSRPLDVRAALRRDRRSRT